MLGPRPCDLACRFLVQRDRARRRCIEPTLSQIGPTRTKSPTNAIDSRQRSLRCYSVTPQAAGHHPGARGRGVCRYEVVPIEHQNWLAACAVGAGHPVCARVRAFPFRRRAGCSRDSICPGANRIFLSRSSRTRRSWSVGPAACLRSRPAAERCLRDLRRHGARQHSSVLNATGLAAAASGGVAIFGRRCRVRSSELRSPSLSAARSPRFLISID